MSRRKERKDLSSTDFDNNELGNIVFADVAKKLGFEMNSPVMSPRIETDVAPVSSEDVTAKLSSLGRIVVRLEKKGHGGKTVTSVEGIGLSLEELKIISRMMRKSLGCGSTIDGNRILLQGDKRERLEQWLTNRGVKKVIRGN